MREFSKIEILAHCIEWVVEMLMLILCAASFIFIAAGTLLSIWDEIKNRRKEKL